MVPTRDHFEARYVAPVVAIARGWERQLERGATRSSTKKGCRSPRRAISVGCSGRRSPTWRSPTPRSIFAVAEGRLLRERTPSYLREVWRSPHWRLFAVLDARPLVQPPGRTTRMSSDSFTLSAPRAGSYLVRVRFTPYWKVTGGSGCVEEAPGGFTEVRRRPGALGVGIGFSLARVFEHGGRCS